MRKFILGCGVGVAATFGIGLALGQFPGVTGTRADDAGAPASQPTISWHSGWGMGITEYLVDDGKGNQLNIFYRDSVNIFEPGKHRYSITHSPSK